MLILGGVILVPTTALIGFILYSEASGTTPKPIDLPAWMQTKEEVSENQISEDQLAASEQLDEPTSISGDQALDQSVSTNQTIQLVYTNETTPATTSSDDYQIENDLSGEVQAGEEQTEELSDTDSETDTASGEDENMQVWVNEESKYYHNVQSCKDTHNSSTITLKEAKSMGYKQCSDCW